MVTRWSTYSFDKLATSIGQLGTCCLASTEVIQVSDLEGQKAEDRKEAAKKRHQAFRCNQSIDNPAEGVGLARLTRLAP